MKKKNTSLAKFLEDQSGILMGEYIVVTLVLLLLIGGLVYDSKISKYVNKYVNLFSGPAILGSEATTHSYMSVDGEYQFKTISEAEMALDKYGLVGSSYAANVKNVMNVVASPLP